jgi:hypothetical protein
MLPLTPWLLVSNAMTLSAFEHSGRRKDADGGRPSATARGREASLGFVHYVGFWSHFSPSSGCSSWSLPLSVPLDGLTRFVREKSVLAPRPQAGDVFLLGSADGRRYARAGIITNVEKVTRLLNDAPAFVCMTVEGELDAKGGDASAPRITARQVRRQLSPAYGDCFIRWSDLVTEASPALVDYRVPKHLISRREDTRAKDRRGSDRTRRRKAA